MSHYFDQLCASVDRPAQLGPDAGGGSFWLKSEPIMNDAGVVIRGGMWPKQLQWWNLPNFVKVLVGGFGAGKTAIGAKRIISSAIENAPCPVAAVSPTYPLSRQTIIATIKSYLAGKRSIYGRQFWWKFNESTKEFKIRFRGRDALIICYSGDKPESLRGPNLASAWIDEPFLQDEEVFRQMIARVRHPNAVHRELFLTGTPEQLNWGYDVCVGTYKDRLDVGVVHSSSRDNKALDKGYVQRLIGAYEGRAAEAFVDGQFVNLSTGAVFYGFDMARNVRDLPLPDLRVTELGVGMDFNVNPMAAVVFWRQGPHMHFIEEIELPNADTEYMCSTLREKYGERLVNVYPDASGNQRHTNAPGGRSDFWYIKNAGYTINVKDENPKRKDSFNAVNGKLNPKVGEPTITISPKCVKLIKYLMTYTHEDMNTEEQKKMSHLLDAFRYPPSYLFPVNKETLGVHKLMGV